MYHRCSLRTYFRDIWGCHESISRLQSLLKSDENIGALHEDLRFIVAGDKFSIKVFFFFVQLTLTVVACAFPFYRWLLEILFQHTVWS
jgi:hypothetical protein